MKGCQKSNPKGVAPSFFKVVTFGVHCDASYGL